MVDKNNEEIHIGDIIKPYNGEGRVLRVFWEGDTEEYGYVLLGQQVLDPLASSPLTQKDLSAMWILDKE